MRLILVLATLIACESASAGFVYTDSAGREWLNLRNTVAYSWYDMASHCDVVTGRCSGVLESKLPTYEDTDLDGVYWASADDVRALFYDFGVPLDSLYDGTQTMPSTDGVGIRFYEHFQSLAGGQNFGITAGFTRTLDYSAERGFFIYNGWVSAFGYIGSDGPPPSCCNDRFSVISANNFSFMDGQWGSWMYRVHSVPEPGASGLMAIGLEIGSLLARRRRQASIAVSDAPQPA